MWFRYTEMYQGGVYCLKSWQLRRYLNVDEGKNVSRHEGIYSSDRGLRKRKIFVRSVWFWTSEVWKSCYQKSTADKRVYRHLRGQGETVDLCYWRQSGRGRRICSRFCLKSEASARTDMDAVVLSCFQHFVGEGVFKALKRRDQHATNDVQHIFK